LLIIGSQAVAVIQSDRKRRRNHTVRYVEIVAVAANSKMSENIHRATLPKFIYFWYSWTLKCCWIVYCALLCIMIRRNYRNRTYRHWTHRVIYACKVYMHLQEKPTIKTSRN